MVFEFRDVKRVLDAFRDGSWDRIHLRDADSELLLSVYDEDNAPTAASVGSAQIGGAGLDTEVPRKEAVDKPE